MVFACRLFAKLAECIGMKKPAFIRGKQIMPMGRDRVKWFLPAGFLGWLTVCIGMKKPAKGGWSGTVFGLTLFGKLTDRLSMKKGQVVVFEQVMLFAVGIVIFIVAVTAFSLYQQSFVSTGVERQLDSVKDVLVAKILLLSEGGNASVLVDIPQNLGGELYGINLTQAGLNVSAPFISKWKGSNLYGINKTHTLSGFAPSVRGRVLVKKEGSTIFIQ